MLALLVLAAPASAAEVARIDGARLDARDDRGLGFCMRLTEGDTELDGGSGTCGRAPWRARRSTLIAWLDGDRDRVLAAGAVPASVARAEAQLADGRRIGFDTVAGPARCPSSLSGRSPRSRSPAPCGSPAAAAGAWRPRAIAPGRAFT